MTTLTVQQAVFGSLGPTLSLEGHTQALVPKPAYPTYTLDQLDHAKLKRLTTDFGNDAASRILFDAVCGDPENAAFLRALEDCSTAEAAGRRPVFPDGSRLVVIPGGFYKERPEMGSGGEAFLALAKDWDLPAEQVPLQSLGGVATNTAIIREFFAARPAGKDIVVSVSKGGYEFSRALSASPHRFQTVKTWVNVAGLLRGSLAANYILSSWLRRSLLLMFLKAKGGDRAALYELIWQGAGTRRPPTGMRVISCVGLPQAAHFKRKRGALSRRHAALSSEGPNDGATLILDSLVRPGYVLPLWGADHYFRTFSRVETLVRAILTYVAESGWLADDAPQTPEAAKSGA